MSVLPFGRLPDGTPISEIRLTTAAGASASIITRGATVRDLAVPLPNDETSPGGPWLSDIGRLSGGYLLSRRDGRTVCQSHRRWAFSDGRFALSTDT